MEKKIKIALCGTRGIPACYGGFETFAEQLCPRLAQMGFEVKVYGRSHVIDYKDKFYKGVELVLLPAPKHKYLETIVHSILSFVHLLYKPTDVVLVCNAANSPFAWLVKLRAMKLVINVDGIERKRAKWNKLGKLWYLVGEYCSKLFANVIISDAEVIRSYYKEFHNIDSQVITYGYDKSDEGSVKAKLGGGGEVLNSKYLEVLDKFGLREGEYFLFVSRLEPENNAHRVVDAYIKSEISRPLVVVGDAPYASQYIRAIKDRASECTKGRIIFTGYQFNEAYRAFQLGAYAYIQATEVGGTHPALVESMGYANAIIANGAEENIEVLGGSGLVYKFNDIEDLSAKIVDIDQSTDLRDELRLKARARAEEVYNWDNVSKQYAELFRKVI